MDKEKLIGNIKTGGSIVIYAGTASLMRPIIRNGNEDRNGAMKACAYGAGAVISCAVANGASKFFDKMVDEVVKFVDDVRSKKVKEEDSDGR